MKVVLFCGGLGLRMRDPAAFRPEHNQRLGDAPKPMQPIGGRPLLWHIMRWYASQGHGDFILCLGYGADVFRGWFDAAADEVRPTGADVGPHAEQVDLVGGPVDGWRVTFADTGLDAVVGERLRRVRRLVEGEPMFLANYADTFTDVPLGEVIRLAETRRAVATFVAVHTPGSFHVVDFDDSGNVHRLQLITEVDQWINGGYMVLTPEVFDFMREGEELVGPAFDRIQEAGRLYAYRHEGFWQGLDTAKDRHAIEHMWNSGERPWAVWEAAEGAAEAESSVSLA